MHRINSSLVGSTLPRELILLCLVWTLTRLPCSASVPQVRFAWRSRTRPALVWRPAGAWRTWLPERTRPSRPTLRATYFRNLALGRYRLQVSKAGFATQSVSLNVQSEAPVLRTVMLALMRARLPGRRGGNNAASRSGSLAR